MFLQILFESEDVLTIFIDIGFRIHIVLEHVNAKTANVPLLGGQGDVGIFFGEGIKGNALIPELNLNTGGSCQVRQMTVASPVLGA